MKNGLAVFGGGFLGGLARAACNYWWGGPFATLVVNLSGAFLLGYWTTRWLRQGKAGDWLNLAVGTGIIGAWTTFSTMTTTTVTLLTQQPLQGLGYLMVMGGGGLALAWTGRVVAQGKPA